MVLKKYGMGMALISIAIFRKGSPLMGLINSYTNGSSEQNLAIVRGPLPAEQCGKANNNGSSVSSPNGGFMALANFDIKCTTNIYIYIYIYTYTL